MNDTGGISVAAVGPEVFRLGVIKNDSNQVGCSLAPLRVTHRRFTDQSAIRFQSVAVCASEVMCAAVILAQFRRSHSTMALTGVRVLEMAGLAPAPFCGMILADFGASVVRVDRTNTPMDVDRLNRGKRSIAVDLKHPDGVAIVKRLAKHSDVILEPYRPGVMEKMGLSPSAMLAENPSLVYARLTGYGQTGPYKNMAGHDINYLAQSGVLSFLGRKGEKPLAPVNLLADFAGGGLLCAFGIVSALYERSRSGKGQVVDASMADGAAYVGSWLYKSQDLNFVWNGANRGESLLDGGFPLYDTYETKDGKFMAVGALEPQFQAELWKKLSLDPIDMDEILRDPKAARKVLTDRFKQQTQYAWQQVFDGSDACVNAVLDWSSAHRNAHNLERQAFLRNYDGFYEPNPSPKLSRTPAVAKDRHIEVGQHTVAILKELGYADKDIDHFQAKEIVQQLDPQSKL